MRSHALLPVVHNDAQPRIQGGGDGGDGTVIKTDEDVMKTEHWMKELWDEIKAREIWHVKLPGTHNSGVFSDANTIGVRNQALNIGGQLAGGIRAFDIRVTRNNSGTFVMHHSGNYPSDDSQYVEPALKQMKEFVSVHSYEIFVVRLSAGYLSNLEEKDYPALRAMVLKYLEPCLVPWDLAHSYTLENIKNEDKNIILISSVGKQREREALFWDDNDSILRDTWESYQSDFWPTPEEKINWLKPHIAKALTTPRSRFLWASSMIWTINLFDAAIQYANPKLCDWLLEWVIDPAHNAGMNIFGVDFFHVLDNRVVNTLVALNKVPIGRFLSRVGQPSRQYASGSE